MKRMNWKLIRTFLVLCFVGIVSLDTKASASYGEAECTFEDHLVCQEACEPHCTPRYALGLCEPFYNLKTCTCRCYGP